MDLAANEKAGFGWRRFVGGYSGAVGGDDVEAYWGVGVYYGEGVGEDFIAEFLGDGEERSWVWSWTDGFEGLW